MTEKRSTETTDRGRPEGWGPILTIKVSQCAGLWAAWTDEPSDVLVHGHSLVEVIQKFLAAKTSTDRTQTTRHDRWLADALDFGNEHMSKAVVINLKRRGGIPCLKGSRVTIGQILAELAESGGPDEIAARLDLDRVAIENLLYGLATLLEKPVHA